MLDAIGAAKTGGDISNMNNVLRSASILNIEAGASDQHLVKARDPIVEESTYLTPSLSPVLPTVCSPYGLLTILGSYTVELTFVNMAPGKHPIPRRSVSLVEEP